MREIAQIKKLDEEMLMNILLHGPNTFNYIIYIKVLLEDLCLRIYNFLLFSILILLTICRPNAFSST